MESKQNSARGPSLFCCFFYFTVLWVLQLIKSPQKNLNWLEKQKEMIGGYSSQVCLLCCAPGLLCQLDDACISNPCQKGSNCDTSPVSGNHFCTCPPGYVGTSCDQDVDECSLGKTPLHDLPILRLCLIMISFSLRKHLNFFWWLP